MNDPATAGAERTPAPVDLTGVDPARWPEIRRRVAILDEFVAMHRPPLDVRMAFASRLGLSVSQFLMLARVWRITRSASAIPGARSRNSAARARRLPARSVEIMREAIKALGPTARRKDVLAEVGRRCAEEGVEPPSGSTVANMLADARADMKADTDLHPEILIDECVARLPVACGDAVAMPRLLIAVALPQRRIIGTEISCDPDEPPSAARLMATLRLPSSEGAPPVPVRAPHHPDAEAAAGQKGSRDGPSLARVLGNRIGDLYIFHRASMARPGAALIAGRHDSALGPADAATAIRTAIDSHNAKLQAPRAHASRSARGTRGCGPCPAPAAQRPSPRSPP